MIVPKLGIDQSKDNFDACLLCGDKIRKKKFSNDNSGFRALSQWLSTNEVTKTHMCAESTGRYGNKLAEYMYARGHKVSIVNPRWISNHRGAMGKRNKNDSGDAFVCADYARAHEPIEWKPKDRLNEELGDILGESSLVKKMIVALTNRGKCGLESAFVVSFNSDVIALLEDKLDTLNTRANKLVASNKEMLANFKIFDSVPGIGRETALALTAKVDFSQFRNGRDLAVFLGLNSQEWQSGNQKRRGKQCKQGDQQLRALLHMGAMSATYSNSLYIEFADRLRTKRLKEGQIINAVARKMILIAHALYRKQQVFDACYAHPLAKTS